jgi:hypothetical protein
MTDRRRRRATPAEDASHEDNPFAAPPEGRPDQPWRPRGQGGGSGSGSGWGSGPGSDSEEGEKGSGSDSDQNGRSAWGDQWSSRQPGRQSGGFGGPRGGGHDGGGPGSGPGRGLRWDPTDPPQRHARYSLHAGVWGLFFALFSLTEIALLLGALSMYWGVSALRGDKSGAGSGSSDKGRGGRRGSRARATAEDVAGTDRTGEQPDTPKQTPHVPVAVTPAQAAKSRTTAAISGLITATLTLAIVAGSFTLRQVHSDYFACREDALTQSSREECSDLLPDTWWRPLLEEPRQSSDTGLGMP